MDINVENPLVSIIATFYNAESYARGCVNTLIAQSFKSYEVILVDDGSVDNTPSILDGYARQGIVRVVHTSNCGVSHARNVGVENARGDYVSFVDGDDFVHSGYLSELVGALKGSGCTMIVSKPLLLRADAERGDQSFPSEQGGFQTIDSKRALHIACYDNLLASWGCLAPKDMYQELPFPDGLVYEDIYRAAAYISHHEHIAILNKHVYGYVMRPGSVVHKSKAETRQGQNYITAIERFSEDAKAAGLGDDTALAYMRAINYARLHTLCNSMDEEDVETARLNAIALDRARDCWRTAKGDKRIPKTQRVRLMALSMNPEIYDRIMAVAKRGLQGV